MCNYPAAKKNDEYKEMVRMRHPYMTDVWCTMDELKVMLEQSGDHLIQEQYYNGWTHDHYVSSVLCFCPDGRIPIALINIQAVSTTARLLTMEAYMTSLRQCTCRMVQSVPPTLHLETLVMNF
jgi:hypothetical protein